MDNYFDLDFHPVAKKYLARYDDEMSTKRDIGESTKAIATSKVFKDFTDETILRTLESQCCINHLNMPIPKKYDRRRLGLYRPKKKRAR